MYRTPAQRVRDLEAAVSNAAIDVEVGLPEDRYLEVDGVRLHALDWGIPSAHATPVILLHGGGLTAHTWDLTSLALRDTYRCLAVDLRGHGDSDWSRTGDYSLNRMARDLEAVVGDVGGAPVVVGMSLGGLAGMAYAAHHWPRLTALVLVDVVPRLQLDRSRHIWAFMRAERELPTVDAFVDRAMAFNPRRTRRHLERTLPYNLQRTATGGWTWKYDPSRLDRSYPEERERLREEVRRIGCPVLLVRGSESGIVDRSDAEHFVSAVSGATLVEVEGAGHNVQGDQPKRFITVLQRFLAELELR